MTAPVPTSAAFAPAEPLRDVAYCYDGTLEGLLTAVFQSYALHEEPQDVVPEGVLQRRLGQSVRHIDADEALACRVRAGIVRAAGSAAFEAVAHASLSDDPTAGTAVYRFIRYAMARERMGARGAILSELAHPAVGPLAKLDRAVMNERHRMQQFLRFEHLETGVWYARCNPNANVVPLLMDWFSGRFNTQPFLIFDEVHRIAGVYGGRGWHLVRTDDVQVPPHAADEKLMRAAWKRFYDAVSVEARYHPELRRQFMPKRLWKNILETHERIPGKELELRG